MKMMNKEAIQFNPLSTLIKKITPQLTDKLTPIIYLKTAHHSSPIPYLTELAGRQFSPMDKVHHALLRRIMDGAVWKESIKRHKDFDSFIGIDKLNKFYDDVERMYPNLKRYTKHSTLTPDVGVEGNIFIRS